MARTVAWPEDSVRLRPMPEAAKGASFFGANEKGSLPFAPGRTIVTRVGNAAEEGLSDRELPNALSLTANVVAAYVSKNAVRATELPDLIASVHASLVGVVVPVPQGQPQAGLKPAVPIKKSVTQDYIVSLEDGRKFKSMKRYLGLLGMTPDDYRAKWSLPRDYPMVAPAYASKRSELARSTGLGSNRRRAEVAEAGPITSPQGADGVRESAPSRLTTEEPAEPSGPAGMPAKRRGRPKKDLPGSTETTEPRSGKDAASMSGPAPEEALSKESERPKKPRGRPRKAG